VLDICTLLIQYNANINTGAVIDQVLTTPLEIATKSIFDLFLFFF